MTDYAPGEIADPRDEVTAALCDLIPSAFTGGVIDRATLLDALGLLNEEPAPAVSFSLPSIGLARSEARAATAVTLVPDVDGSPDGAIDYTNNTDHDSPRIELQLGGESR